MNKFLVLLLVLWSLSTLQARDTGYYASNKTWTPRLEEAAQTDQTGYYLASLGSCYDRGDGVTQNKQKAFELFKKAAALGNFLGKHNLAIYLSEGTCTEPDNKEALRLLNEVVADTPNMYSSYLLMADIYEKGGAGVEQDYKKALEYLTYVAEQKGWGDVNFRVGQYYYYGRGVEKDREKARNYFLSAVNTGTNITSMLMLAQMSNEEGNYPEALEWLHKVYDTGVKFACYMLGDMYYNGHGVEQSYAKAFELFDEGKEAHSGCKFRMAEMLREGIWVAKDPERARVLYLEAAEKGNGQACYRVASDYYLGKEGKQDDGLAVKYFNMALEKADYLPDAVNADIYKILSSCYRFGRGVEKDEAKADELLKKSADYGNPDADEIRKWLNL